MVAATVLHAAKARSACTTPVVAANTQHALCCGELPREYSQRLHAHNAQSQPLL